MGGGEGGAGGGGLGGEGGGEGGGGGGGGDGGEGDGGGGSVAHRCETPSESAPPTHSARAEHRSAQSCTRVSYGVGVKPGMPTEPRS